MVVREVACMAYEDRNDVPMNKQLNGSAMMTVNYKYKIGKNLCQIAGLSRIQGGPYACGRLMPSCASSPRK
jgi:hypothetical protein